MSHVVERSQWAEFLKAFSERNAGKPTRIGVFESANGLANDYWLEDGLPLLALDGYDRAGRMYIDIFFDKYTHSIEDAAVLVSIQSAGADGGLDISDNRGRTTLLRFENWNSGSEDH